MNPIEIKLFSLRAMVNAQNDNSNFFKSYYRFIEVPLAFVLFAILALPFYKQIPNTLIHNRDEYKHLLIARSLVTTGSIDQEVLKGIQYPPGWAAVNSFLLIFFGNQLKAAHTLTTVLAWCTGVLVYIYLRKQTEPILALAIGGFFSAHFLTITLADTLMSEPVFGFIWFLCLLWLRQPENSRWYYWILTGLFVTLCMSVRTVGLSLWIGSFFYLTINSKTNLSNKVLHIGCLCIIPLFYLLFLTVFNPTMGVIADKGYGGQFFSVGINNSSEIAAGTIKRTVQEFPLHTLDVLQAISPIRMGSELRVDSPCLFIAFGIVILALLGWYRKIRRNPTPLEYTFASYLGIYFVWPYTGYPRFFWPVVPIILFYAISFLSVLKIYKKRIGLTTVILASLIIMTAMVSLKKNIYIYTTLRLWIAEHELAIQAAVNEALRLTSAPTIATISYFKIMYHFPNIRICRLGYNNDKESHQNRIKQCGATFLLSENHHMQFFDSLIIHENSKYQLVFQKHNVYLWHIKD